MPNKPVDDIANSEIEFRLGRIVSDLKILSSVGAHLQDLHFKRHVKEVRQAMGSLGVYIKKKYGVSFPKSKGGYFE